ncbi:MAG: hypothetical protein F2663_06800 [Actinobacteria bacterium]|uniref:Unannotated protein n=1 Tax=freshwater metagenome TaxID=449393 RepID=A0A6J6PVS4_9ZZZZ|nr:hypothetical protein [Actinomycetota bacterium]
MVRLRVDRVEAVVICVTVAIAAASFLTNVGRMTHVLSHEYAIYSKYSNADRRHAATDQLQIPGDVLDFYAERVAKGDRVYFQVDPSGLSANMTLEQAVAFAGRFYLLPAVQTSDLANANTVVSFQADPGVLGLHYSAQERAGLQLFFVSKIEGR